MKNNHLFKILAILFVIVAVWSCQTDLVSPRTENIAVSQNQSLSARTSNNSSTTALEEREDDHALFAKIVARRDNPETWDALGNSEHLEYYARVFDKNPEVQAIFYDDGCGEFSAIVIPTGTSEEVGIVNPTNTLEESRYIKAIPTNGNNGGGLKLKIIKQPDGALPTCMANWRNYFLSFWPCNRIDC